MADYTKMVVIENGQTAVIQDNAGNRVIFDTLEDATRCTSINFTNKFYVGYEPDINFFQDSRDETVNASMIPYAPYEALIGIIPTLQQRKDDITYGLTGQALADAQAKVAEIAAEEARLAELEQEIESDDIRRVTKAEIDAKLDQVYNPTEFLAASDFASLKTAIGNIFQRQKQLDRKIAYRLMRIGL